MSKPDYPNSLEGVCRWACDSAGVDFNKLLPKDVTIALKNGTWFTADQPPHTPWSGGDILFFRIKHPDAAEPFTVEVGARQ